MKHKLVIVAISSALALSAKAVPAEEPQFVSECPGWNCTSEGQICVTGDGKNEERFQYVCKDSRWEELQTGTKELTQALENVEWRKLHDALRKSTPSATEPTPAYVNKCAGWSCEQNGQICVEDEPVVLWGTDAGIFYNMLHGSFEYNNKHRNTGAYYLCSNNAWNVIDRDEANKHLERLFRDKGTIGDWD